jgi:hypothetical protein
VVGPLIEQSILFLRSTEVRLAAPRWARVGGRVRDAHDGRLSYEHGNEKKE